MHFTCGTLDIHNYIQKLIKNISQTLINMATLGIEPNKTDVVGMTLGVAHETTRAPCSTRCLQNKNI